MTTEDLETAAIEADPDLPIFRITREFRATPSQLLRAHTDPELYRRWVGPDNAQITIDYWDARTGGSFRFLDREHGFRGCFHEIRADRIVQTFTWEGNPEQVALQTFAFIELGNGITRLSAESLCSRFEDRDAWLRSGMETGVNEGYNKLDLILSAGTV